MRGTRLGEAGSFSPCWPPLRFLPAARTCSQLRSIGTSSSVRLAYSKIGAHTAECGPWPDQTARNPENRHYANYGCATQQNLAAMVANPLDLLYPRAMTPPDAVRRTAVIGGSEGAPGVTAP